MDDFTDDSMLSLARTDCYDQIDAMKPTTVANLFIRFSQWRDKYTATDARVIVEYKIGHIIIIYLRNKLS